VKLGPFEVPGYHVGEVRDCLSRIPDGCIQTIFTSPPYFRKRTYDKTQLTIWDDDPDCDHNWIWNKRLTTSGGLSIGNAKVGATKAGIQRGFISEATCQKCGAWNGALGTEKKTGDYVRHCLEIFVELRRVLRDDGTLFWNVADSYDPNGGKTLVGIPFLIFFALRKAGFLVRNVIQWTKQNPMPTTAKDRLANAHEPIFLCSKSKRYKWTKIKGESRDVWEVNLEPWGKHPALFPVALPERAIRHATEPGDVVLDPFAGSGTTIAVADALDRRGLGFDTSPGFASLLPERRRFVLSKLSGV